MSECKLDHTHEDVKQKYEQQKQFLPKELSSLFEVFFKEEHPQEKLNEVFHLLKKYDLSTEEEQEKRAIRLNELIKDI